MKKINVLIFPCEGINSIELHDALSNCVNINVLGASSVKREGRFVFKNYISEIPNIDECDFIEKLNIVIKNYNIDIIFPTHDTVVQYLAEHKDDINAKIISDDKFTAEICRSKKKTHDLFSGYDFMPNRIKSLEEKIHFPLFSKPDDSQGGNGAHVINSYEELENEDFSKNIITEYLPGEEYTVDCFTDKQSRLRYVAPRQRYRIMSGICVSGTTLPINQEISHIAEIINSKLKFQGLWYFQLRKDKFGKMKLLEISCRCSGTMCLTRARGINLPMLSVYNALGYDLTLFDNGLNIEMERILTGLYQVNCHYENVYIDFDDTIVVNDSVNLKAVSFLYQCKNNHKNVFLLTKHEFDIYDSLKRYALSADLFDQIIHLNNGLNKSGYIHSKNSIFIDNSYKERLDVHVNCQIPVFDVDALEFLIDHKK